MSDRIDIFLMDVLALIQNQLKINQKDIRLLATHMCVISLVSKNLTHPGTDEVGIYVQKLIRDKYHVSPSSM